MKGLKIKIKPITYEIEVINIGEEIKEGEKEHFLEWLDDKCNDFFNCR